MGVRLGVPDVAVWEGVDNFLETMILGKMSALKG